MLLGALVVFGCGGDATEPTSPVTLEVTPTTVKPGQEVDLLLNAEAAAQASSESLTTLETMRSGNWQEIGYLSSRDPGELLEKTEGSPAVGVAIEPGQKETLRIPKELSAGSYRLKKRVALGGDTSTEVVAEIQVVK